MICVFCVWKQELNTREVGIKRLEAAECTSAFQISWAEWTTLIPTPCARGRAGNFLRVACREFIFVALEKVIFFRFAAVHKPHPMHCLRLSSFGSEALVRFAAIPNRIHSPIMERKLRSNSFFRFSL